MQRIKKYIPQSVKNIKYFLKGINTYLPSRFNWLLPEHQYQFLNDKIHRSGVRQRPVTARTCYSLWLRLLVYLKNNNINNKFDAIAEIGPGDSLGIGLSALLSGTNKFYAFDIEERGFNNSNEMLLNELVDLYKNKSDIPDNIELPKAKPFLNSYKFPANILNDELLNRCLSDERVAAIKKALQNTKDDSEGNKEDVEIKYIVPWNNNAKIKKSSLDLICSWAVMEHVDDLANVYSAMNHWLKSGGIVAHLISFNMHNTATRWNGHWTYSEKAWRVIRGKCVYLINREPYSSHARLLKQNNFKILSEWLYRKPNTLKRRNLSASFKSKVSDEDMEIYSALVIAQKQ